MHPFLKLNELLTCIFFIIIAFLLLNLTILRNEETNTFNKWVFNTVKQSQSNSRFNLQVLELYYAKKDFENGRKLAEIIYTHNKEKPIYEIWKLVYNFDLESLQNKKKSIETVAHLLLANTNNDFKINSCAIFNIFVINNISAFTSPYRASILIDKLLGVQMDKMSKDPEQFKDLIVYYSKNLNSLRAYYLKKVNQKVKLSPNEQSHYAEVLFNLEKYFQVKYKNLR